eukprot:229050_1
MSTPNIWLNRKQISSVDVREPHINGRTPWYLNSSKSKKHKQTFLIGVAGGTASGKTSVCKAIVNNLRLPWVQILSLDCFYRPLTDEERADVGNYNFDHPNAFDWDLLLNVLQELKQGKAVKCPEYDFTTHSRKDEYTLMYGADVVLVEGILMLHNPDIVNQFDVKVFVKTDDDIRLIRRIKRDIAERGRTLDGVIAQYQKTVKPSYTLFCEPTQAVADIVIPRGRDNTVAIQLLCDHIKNKLIEGGNINPVFYRHSKYESDDTSKWIMPSNVMLPPNDHKIVKVQAAVDALDDDTLNGTQLLHNISLLCNRLLALCLEVFIPRRFCTPSPEHTPSPYEPQSTPEIVIMEEEETEEEEDTDEEAKHSCDECEAKEKVGIKIAKIALPSAVEQHEFKICVVTIFSGGMIFGETIMEQMGNNKSYSINFGSIHIFHERQKPAKPRFYDRKLPHDIHRQKVIMVDAFIGTGNRARMALQVMVDHHVPEQNICFISLVSSQQGIVNLARVFPSVQFITARIDSSGDHGHWETRPVTSELVIKYCDASGIDIVDDDSDSMSCLH